jgi:hypothetical protein
VEIIWEDAAVSAEAVVADLAAAAAEDLEADSAVVAAGFGYY